VTTVKRKQILIHKAKTNLQVRVGPNHQKSEDSEISVFKSITY